jgi:hypothetical protein
VHGCEGAIVVRVLNDLRDFFLKPLVTQLQNQIVSLNLLYHVSNRHAVLDNFEFVFFVLLPFGLGLVVHNIVDHSDRKHLFVEVLELDDVLGACSVLLLDSLNAVGLLLRKNMILPVDLVASESGNHGHNRYINQFLEPLHGHKSGFCFGFLTGGVQLLLCLVLSGCGHPLLQSALHYF